MKVFKSQFDLLDSLEKRPETMRSLCGCDYNKASSKYSRIENMLNSLIKSGFVCKTSYNGTSHGRNSMVVYYYAHKKYYLVFSKPLFKRGINVYYLRTKPILKSESYLLEDARSLKKIGTGMYWKRVGKIFVHENNVRKII